MPKICYLLCCGYLLVIHGFKRFLKVTWEPFEQQFKSIEDRFIRHKQLVLESATLEHQIYFYKKEARKEGQCYIA